MRCLLCLLIVSTIVLTYAKEQSIKVRGQVICDKRSVRNVRVELREHDTLDPDDSLGETHTDKDGFFSISGTEDEVGTIRPYLRITHTCEVKDRATCHRTTDFELPADKINNGEFDMNFVNLNLRGNADSEKCE
uniref:Transthyretin-like family protein n=1 Tax=Acrobeloides nanus TaxID=290746 RepID=A0A914C9T2_9BILA